MPRTGTAARSPSWSSRTGRAAPSTRFTAPSTAWWTRSSPAPTPTWGRAARTREPPRLDREFRHQLPHRRGGAVERRLLIGGELDLDDLLEAPGSQARRYAEEQIAVAILPVQGDGARQDPVLVEQDRLHHLDDGRRRGVVGAARLEQVDDLDAAVARALHDGVDLLIGEELGDRDAGDGRVARQRDHRVAVPAQNEGVGVGDRHPQGLGDEEAHAR